MSKQKETVIAGIKNLLTAETCPRCDTYWEASFKYCCQCGLENPNFSEIAFRDLEGENYDKAVRISCGSGHPELEGLKAEDAHGLTRFCTLCGKRLYD